MVKHLLGTDTGIDKVEAGCHAEHYAMRTILKRCLSFEGGRPDHFLNDDGSRGAVVYFGRCR